MAVLMEYVIETPPISPLVPAKAGPRAKDWMPAFAGREGGLGSRACRRPELRENAPLLAGQRQSGNDFIPINGRGSGERRVRFCGLRLSRISDGGILIEERSGHHQALSSKLDPQRKHIMEFVTAYLKMIDLLAIIAVVILVAVAFYRKENFWFGLLVVAVVIWAAQRIFGLF
jgi:hypothetical protein